MSEEPEASDRITVAAQIIGAGTSTGITLLLVRDPGLATVVGAAATPVVSAALDRILSRAWQGQLRQAEEAVRAAAEHAGMTVDGLAGALTGDRRRAGLLARAVEVAQHATFDEKVAALARALGQVALDDALIDISELVVNALDLLEAPHIRVLSWLVEKDDLQLDDPRRIEVFGTNPPPAESNVSAGTLQAFHPALAPGMAAIVAALASTGCLGPPGGLVSGGYGSYRVSDFGRCLLEYLTEYSVVGRPDDPGPDGDPRAA